MSILNAIKGVIFEVPEEETQSESLTTTAQPEPTPVVEHKVNSLEGIPVTTTEEAPVEVNEELANCLMEDLQKSRNGVVGYFEVKNALLKMANTSGMDTKTKIDMIINSLSAVNPNLSVDSLVSELTELRDLLASNIAGAVDELDAKVEEIITPLEKSRDSLEAEIERLKDQLLSKENELANLNAQILDNSCELSRESKVLKATYEKVREILEHDQSVISGK